MAEQPSKLKERKSAAIVRIRKASIKIALMVMEATDLCNQ
ncbi:Uncharacterised protein [Vibrio cholerae]|nr:Uncharacterised protein [Vibrio cholerae]CSI15689.1 Uncharacterised protein [Vibrio cholerae]CSI65115.1 Uncharacterised protein [Vibrio cholerae]